MAGTAQLRAQRLTCSLALDNFRLELAPAPAATPGLAQRPLLLGGLALDSLVALLHQVGLGRVPLRWQRRVDGSRAGRAGGRAAARLQRSFGPADVRPSPDGRVVTVFLPESGARIVLSTNETRIEAETSATRRQLQALVQQHLQAL